MIKKRIRTSVIPVILMLLVAEGCSLPPEVPVTRSQLMKTGIYYQFIIEESPEQLLNAMNAEGDVVIEAKRRIRGKDYPVYIKLLATPQGIEVVDYDR